jgi:RNA polymerase sigma factor (sigma-70 family)
VPLQLTNDIRDNRLRSSSIVSTSHVGWPRRPLSDNASLADLLNWKLEPGNWNLAAKPRCALTLLRNMGSVPRLPERHDPSVYACLHRIVRNSEDARELASKCWECVFAKLREFDPTRDFRAWAVGFARRLGWAVLRQRKHLPRIERMDAVPEEELPSLPGPEDEHALRLAEEEVLRMVAPLSRNQQVAVLGHCCDEMSYKELALLTGRKPGTLQSDFRRGLAELRRRMG